MRNETLRNFPWHLLLAFLYPPLNNWVMNRAVEWLGSSDLTSRVITVFAGVAVSSALLVVTCRFVARRSTLWLGILIGIVGFWFYYVYHPEQSVAILLASIMRDLASFLNMLTILFVPMILGVIGNQMTGIQDKSSSSSSHSASLD